LEAKNHENHTMIFMSDMAVASLYIRNTSGTFKLCGAAAGVGGMETVAEN
jgi:hypothetical protein